MSNREKLYWQLAWSHEKNVWAVGYVGGKHSVSVDADNYVFALLFMDITACAGEGYLW